MQTLMGRGPVRFFVKRVSKGRNLFAVSLGSGRNSKEKATIRKPQPTNHSFRGDTPQGKETTEQIRCPF